MLGLDLISKLAPLFLLCLAASRLIAEVQTVHEQDKTVSVRTPEGVVNYLLPSALQGASTYEILLQVSPEEFEVATKAEEEKLRREAQVMAEAAHRYDKERKGVQDDEGDERGDERGDEATSNQKAGKSASMEPVLESSDYLAKAYQHFHREEFSEALRSLKVAAQLKKNDPRIFAMMGSLYYRLGLLEEASQNWKKSLEIAPKQPEVVQALKGLEAEKKSKQ